MNATAPANGPAATAADAPTHAMRVGLVEWQPGGDEINSTVADEVGRLGHSVAYVAHDGALAEDLDVLLACGPFGSMIPLAAQLRARPPARRPAFVLWMTEQLSNPALPIWLARAVAELRSGLERRVLLADGGSAARLVPHAKWVTTRALRFRYYGDLLWLRRQGLLSVLAIPSGWLAQFLRDRGFAVTHARMGAHPRWGADLGLERDIPVLWLGSLQSGRRRRRLATVCGQLRERGITVTVADGVAHPPVYGNARVQLLNRTKIVLNLLRAPWDSNALRFFLAAPNRALVVSEPTLRHHPLGNETHLVEAPVERMADVVCRYLADDAARGRIVDAAHRLVTTELTMARGVSVVMQAAGRARAAATGS